MIKKEKLKAIEFFMRNRITLEIVGVDLPSDAIRGMTPIVYSASKSKWNPLTITFIDEIDKNISMKLMRLAELNNPSQIGVRLTKLDNVGEAKEIFEIEGILSEVDFGGFSYIPAPDLMGLTYDIGNEIDLTLTILSVTVK